MTDDPSAAPEETSGEDTPAARLAQALARRKATAGGGSGAPKPGRTAERAAAARSASKSNPALRK